MPLFWLRVAVVFYGAGLGYALYALARRRDALSRTIVPVLSLALVLHGVALIEVLALNGRSSIVTIHQSESLLAWLLMALFLITYLRYRTTSPGLFVIPVVFLLTLSAALAQTPPRFTSPLARNGWIIAHVALIFTGYSALFLSFVASVLYLWQERLLKSKRFSGVLSKLPSLQMIDDMGYRTLLLGFPVHHAGTDHGQRARGIRISAPPISAIRKSCSPLVHVVPLCRAALFPLELRLAGEARCLLRDFRFCRRHLRLGRQPGKRRASVRRPMSMPPKPPSLVLVGAQPPLRSRRAARATLLLDNQSCRPF